MAQLVKNPPAMQETLGGKDPLEKGMTTHSSILGWEISWMEEPGGLQIMGSHRVEHNLVIIANEQQGDFSLDSV